jgi:hypothetical protein
MSTKLVIHLKILFELKRKIENIWGKKSHSILVVFLKKRREDLVGGKEIDLVEGFSGEKFG